MPDYVTKEYFDQRLDGVVSTIREDIRDVISHFNKSQAEQNKRLDVMDKRFDGVDKRLDGIDARFDQIDSKLDAIMEMLATRKELHNLVRALKKQGVVLDEAEIFTV